MMQRVFVVNADDLGVSRGSTMGIVRAHLEGVVSSASISPTGNDYEHAVAITREKCPNLGIGLHFTLSAGKPVSPPEKVPLLVDESGYFRWEFISLLRSLGFKKEGKLLDQIAIELEAQLQRLMEDGVIPDHIDSERHVHLIPGIFKRVILAAHRYNIPFVRAADDFTLRFARLSNFNNVVLHGGMLKYALLQRLLSRCRAQSLVGSEPGVRFCSQFASYIFTGRLDVILENVFLKAPAGITEIMVHPGIPELSESTRLGNPGLENYLTHQDRRRELEACVAAKSKFNQDVICRFRDL